MPPEPCPGCHVELEPFEGPAHRYIGASPACWDVFARLQAGDPPTTAGPQVQLIVDAFAAQHPGDSSPQATQSVAVHVMTLDAALGGDLAPADYARFRQDVVAWGRAVGGFPKLVPEPDGWPLTVHDVVSACDADVRADTARAWARAVLLTWTDLHGDAIESWRRAAPGP